MGEGVAGGVEAEHVHSRPCHARHYLPTPHCCALNTIRVSVETAGVTGERVWQEVWKLYTFTAVPVTPNITSQLHMAVLSILSEYLLRQRG